MAPLGQEGIHGYTRSQWQEWIVVMDRNRLQVNRFVDDGGKQVRSQAGSSVELAQGELAQGEPASSSASSFVLPHADPTLDVVLVGRSEKRENNVPGESADIL